MLPSQNIETTNTANFRSDIHGYSNPCMNDFRSAPYGRINKSRSTVQHNAYSSDNSDLRRNEQSRTSDFKTKFSPLTLPALPNRCAMLPFQPAGNRIISNPLLRWRPEHTHNEIAQKEIWNRAFEQPVPLVDQMNSHVTNETVSAQRFPIFFDSQNFDSFNNKDYYVGRWSPSMSMESSYKDPMDMSIRLHNQNHPSQMNRYSVLEYPSKRFSGPTDLPTVNGIAPNFNWRNGNEIQSNIRTFQQDCNSSFVSPEKPSKQRYRQVYYGGNGGDWQSTHCQNDRMRMSNSLPSVSTAEKPQNLPIVNNEPYDSDPYFVMWAKGGGGETTAMGPKIRTSARCIDGRTGRPFTPSVILDSSKEVNSQPIASTTNLLSPNLTIQGSRFNADWRCFSSKTEEVVSGRHFANSENVSLLSDVNGIAAMLSMEKYVMQKMICEVCFDMEPTLGNELLICDGCGVVVHQKCYGVLEVKIDDSVTNVAVHKVLSAASKHHAPASLNGWLCEICKYLRSQGNNMGGQCVQKISQYLPPALKTAALGSDAIRLPETQCLANNVSKNDVSASTCVKHELVGHNIDPLFDTDDLSSISSVSSSTVDKEISQDDQKEPSSDLNSGSTTNEAQKYKCCLCDTPGGAVVKANNDRWVHVICVIYAKDEPVVVSQINSDNPISVDDLLIDRNDRDLICYVCKSSFGAPVKCKVDNCLLGFHLPCILKAGISPRLEFVHSSNGKRERLVKVLVCSKHSTDKCRLSIMERERQTLEDLDPSFQRDSETTPPAKVQRLTSPSTPSTTSSPRRIVPTETNRRNRDPLSVAMVKSILSPIRQKEIKPTEIVTEVSRRRVQPKSTLVLRRRKTVLSCKSDDEDEDVCSQETCDNEQSSEDELVATRRLKKRLTRRTRPSVAHEKEPERSHFTRRSNTAKSEMRELLRKASATEEDELGAAAGLSKLINAPQRGTKWNWKKTDEYFSRLQLPDGWMRCITNDELRHKLCEAAGLTLPQRTANSNMKFDSQKEVRGDRSDTSSDNQTKVKYFGETVSLDRRDQLWNILCDVSDLGTSDGFAQSLIDDQTNAILQIWDNYLQAQESNTPLKHLTEGVKFDRTIVCNLKSEIVPSQITISIHGTSHPVLIYHSSRKYHQTITQFLTRMKGIPLKREIPNETNGNPGQMKRIKIRRGVKRQSLEYFRHQKVFNKKRCIGDEAYHVKSEQSRTSCNTFGRLNTALTRQRLLRSCLKVDLPILAKMEEVDKCKRTLFRVVNLHHVTPRHIDKLLEDDSPNNRISIEEDHAWPVDPYTVIDAPELSEPFYVSDVLPIDRYIEATNNRDLIDADNLDFVDKQLELFMRIYNKVESELDEWRAAAIVNILKDNFSAYTASETNISQDLQDKFELFYD